MKPNKYFIRILFTVIILLFFTGCKTEVTNYYGVFRWQPDGSRGVVITGYTGPIEGDVVIPEHIDGLPVTSIGAEAFAGMRMSSVSIPDSVTSIGNMAFFGNRLTVAVLPYSLKYIGYGALRISVYLNT